MNPAKTWVFTWNNYDDAAIATVKGWEGSATRLTVSKEVGEGGTPHLQGAVTWKTAMRLTALKKLSPTAHWEKAVAKEAAFLYCAKEGSELVIQVDNRKQGKRSDLLDVAESIKEGATMREVAREHPVAFMKYHKGIAAYKDIIEIDEVEPEFQLDQFLREPIEDLDKYLYVLHGPPGTGKTSYALAHFTKPLLVSHIEDLRNLEDHDGVVFDDMSFTHWPTEAQIHLCDVANTRSVHARFSNVKLKKGLKRIITTNSDAEEVLNLDPRYGVARRTKRVRVDDPLFADEGAEALLDLNRSEEVLPAEAPVLAIEIPDSDSD